ncbi:hypothetical protein [Burkholderia ubonensis]|uniref:hypothetical protein n=1 Tax=Burkholderia ubonensis TaxID=101571 RepID=UPI0007526DAD|nr:hypothetical protein [Burkholderia ubonensis]
MSPQEIIERLANGIDPITGEILSDQGPFNQPEVIRALFAAAQALRAVADASERQPPPNAKPLNAGRAWSPEEDEQLLRKFDAGVAPKELAKIHGRTKGAIDSRLVKHGRLQR